MRVAKPGGTPSRQGVDDGTLGGVCEVCGESFTPKRLNRRAAACSGRCRAIKSRELRRNHAISRLMVGENALLQGAEALRAVRALLEGSPEGILAVPISGGVR
jgi:predicted nucleic acid-binding Zn ribbon protein